MYKLFLLFIIWGCLLQQAFTATPDLNKVGTPKFPLKEGQIQVYLFKKAQLIGGKDWEYFVHDDTFDQADNKHYTVVNVASGKVLVGLKRGGYWATEPLYVDPQFIGKAIFIQVEDGSNQKLKYEFLDPQAAQVQLNKRYVVGRDYQNNIRTIKNVTIRNPPWKSMARIEIKGQGNENGFLEGKGFIKLSDRSVEGEFKDGFLVGDATAYWGDKEFKGKVDDKFRPLEGTLYNREFNTSFTGQFKNFWEKHGSGICTDKNGIEKECYFINDYDFTEDKPLESIYPLRKEVHALIGEGKDFLYGITNEEQAACFSVRIKLITIKNKGGDSWEVRRAYDDVIDAFEDRERELKRLTNKIEDLIQKMKTNPQDIDAKGFDRLINDKHVGFVWVEKTFYHYFNECLRVGDRALKDIDKIEARRKQREKEAAEYKAKLWAPENFTSLTNKDDPALRMLKQHQEAVRQAQEFNRKTQLTSSYSTQAAWGTTTTSNKQNSVVTKNMELHSSEKENTQQNTQKSIALIKLPTTIYSQSKTSQVTLANKEKPIAKEQTVQMEQFQEAIAYCAEFVSGGWKCNGPIQKIMVKVDTLAEGLSDVGCSNARHHISYIPEGGDPKTQGAVYYCGYGLRSSDRNITKNMIIPTSLLNQRKNYQCPLSQLKRCETEL